MPSHTTLLSDLFTLLNLLNLVTAQALLPNFRHRKLIPNPLLSPPLSPFCLVVHYYQEISPP